LRIAFAVLLLAACAASDPQPIAAPEWDAMPGGVVDALCQRLQAEGIASGAPIAVVKTTQPIVSMPALVALSATSKRRASAERAAEALRQTQKALPLELSGSCAWQPLDRLDPQHDFDLMAVELSAPMVNPFEPREAGLFARVSLGGQHPSWYWISLVPRGGGWVVGSIGALAV
jgi:hypothetical protein